MQRRNRYMDAKKESQAEEKVILSPLPPAGQQEIIYTQATSAGCYATCNAFLYGVKIKDLKC